MGKKPQNINELISYLKEHPRVNYRQTSKENLVVSGENRTFHQYSDGRLFWYRDGKEYGASTPLAKCNSWCLDIETVFHELGFDIHGINKDYDMIEVTHSFKYKD